MNRIMTLCASFLLSCIMGVSVFAQGGYEVKGVVVDAIGPIIGATVIEQGTSNGASTGLDGDYVLTVSSADAIVEISCIGYASQQFVASQVPATVTLGEDNEFLDEVVVIGYGTVKKSDVTGSVSAVKADQLNKGVVTSPVSLLQGKSAGVVVTSGDGAPGSGNTIRIRGGSSLKANNAPLVVVDGLPLSETGISGMGDALASINPNDIETFTVLKDASATAIYGSRASNGVIMITTKKGSRGGGIHVAADFTASLSQNTKYVDVLTGDEMREVMKWYAGEDSDAYKALGTENTDWQKLIYQLAQTYTGNVALSGNVNAKWMKMPYRVSAGYHNQDGTLKGSNLERGTLALNLNPSFLDDHLTVALSGKGMYMSNAFANTTAISQAVQFDPTQNPYDDSANGLNGYYWWNYGKGTATIDNCNAMANQNPLALLNDKKDLSKAWRFIGSAQFTYKVHGFEDLKLNLNLGLDYSSSKGTVDVAPGTEQSFHSTAESGSGYHTNYNQHKNDQTLEFFANYDKTFGSHGLSAMLGYSWQHYYNDSFNERFKADGTSPEDKSYYISKPQTWKTEYFLVSFFGRLNYNWDDRLNVTATLRNDGTSRFQNNKWGLFPSFAASYNFHKDVIKNSNVLSTLKLRLSWGQTGQQDLQAGDYPTLATYTNNTNASMYYFGNNMIVPITPNGYNADLKWETTTTANIGLDFGFVDDRLTLSVDAYKRDTKDLLNFTPVAAGANLSNYLNANIGDLTNKGVELEINAIPVQTLDWSWTVGFNAAYNKTVITRLTNDDERADYYGEVTGGISGGTGNSIQIHQTGQAPNSFFVYQQVYDVNGNPIDGLYVDQNGDGKINDADKYCFEKAAPDWTFGFNTSLSYKQWTLAMSAHSSVGNYVYNNIASNGSLLTDLWTNNFVNNRYWNAQQQNLRSAAYMSDMYVQNASFLKIDNITLSRNFQFGKDDMYNFNVFATVQNLATITKYEGIDPEIFNGIDNNMYPRPRTYILGVKFNF